MRSKRSVNNVKLKKTETIIKKSSIKTPLFIFFICIFSMFLVIFYTFTFLNYSSNLKNSAHSYESTMSKTKEINLRSITQILLKSVINSYDNFNLKQKELKQNGIQFDEDKILQEFKTISEMEIRHLATQNIDFYIFENDGNTLVNTFDVTNEDDNMYGAVDSQGKEYVREIIESASRGGELIQASVEKKGKNEKILFYSIPFETWNWVIAASISSADIDAQISVINKEMGDQLIRQLFLFSIVTLLFLLLGILLINIILSKSLLSPLKRLIKTTHEISNGDLTVKFDYNKHDELGELADAFVKMVDTLKNLNQKIYVAVSILTKNLRTLYKSSTIVKDSANTQAVTVEQTQGNFEGLNRMVETISTESEKADNYAGQALEKAQVGMVSMDKLEKEMMKIETSSREIADIIGMINEIAEQTNLLSLNASIESARAGEAGKGFNIVAGEIRKLAEKSTQAANRINKLITNNNLIIQEGVKYSKSTTNILKEISTANELISGLIKIISDEIEKVRYSSEEVLEAINHISNIAQDNLTESENVALAMSDFVDQTLELQKFVGLFDVRDEEAKIKHKHIEEILKSKLVEADTIFKEFGSAILPTGNTIPVNRFKIPELQIGTMPITNSTMIVDTISQRTHSSVTFFQPVDGELVRVATTVRNFDDTRAIGTSIPETSPIYKTVMAGEIYYGRAFVVNRWYVAVYKPIKDETQFVTGVLYLGIPETFDTQNNSADDHGMIKDDTFTKAKELTL